MTNATTMHTLTVLLLLAVAAPHARVTSLSGLEVQADSTVRFPVLEGSNLEGRRFSLPADFEGAYNVVFVAFRREQQKDVDSWLPFLADQELEARGIRAYELPTLSRSYRMMRGFIDGGMRRGIPAKATREATITLYIDKSPFKKELAIETEARISTFVVARDGRVLWRADGPFTSEAGASLLTLLQTLEVSSPASDPLPGDATEPR